MVRIWRCPLYFLDINRLNGEHHELHVIVGAILRGKGSWFNHPQTKRFHKHLGMLVDRHNQQIEEYKRRSYPSGFNHKSPIRFVDIFEPYIYSKKEMLEDLAILSERQKKTCIFVKL